MRSGRAPLREARPRSSTTARMVMPVRVPRRSTRSPMATTIASRNAEQLVPGDAHAEDRRRSRPRRRRRAAGPRRAARSRCASARQAASRATDTTRRDVSGASFSPRITTRSTKAPNSGATTSRITATASAGRQPPLEELPVGERRQHPHRAVGEVEDARGRVGQHQPAGGDGEDARRRQPGDGGGEEVVHYAVGTSTTLSSSQLKMPSVGSVSSSLITKPSAVTSSCTKHGDGVVGRRVLRGVQAAAGPLGHRRRPPRAGTPG